MRLLRLTLIAVACATIVAACGGSSNSSSSGSSRPPSISSSSTNGHAGASPQSGEVNLTGLANTKPDPSAQHMGGTLTLTSNEGWEHLDPGASYFQIDYVVVYATQTPLYTFTPTSDTPVPLLASGPPQISADGKTVTVHIKPNWKYGPPVNRDITSKDVASGRSSGCSTRTSRTAMPPATSRSWVPIRRPRATSRSRGSAPPTRRRSCSI